MSTTLRKRIEELESRLPVPVTLYLHDGSVFHHPGPALKFCSEVMAEIRVGRGALLDAVRKAVRAEGNMGRLIEALWAVDTPLREKRAGLIPPRSTGGPC